MSNSSENRLSSGGKILVDQLLIHGARMIFGVPGESYLPVLDALYDVRDRLPFIVARHEAAAANMAEAYGKLTGEPGIVFVTRGPGACHAAIGLHTGFQDSTPMILFVGQVARSDREREGFQEVEFRTMFQPLAKWVAEIDDAKRLPEFISRAFHTAVNGRPGPVVLSLPEDVLTDIAQVSAMTRYTRAEAAPSLAALKQFEIMMNVAERPLVIAGGGGWTSQAAEHLQQFAERQGLPVATSFRAADRLDNRHANYSGDVGIGIQSQLAERIHDADLLIVIGARLGEMTTSAFTLIDIPRPKQKLIHIYPGAEELGRIYQGDLLINATMPAALIALAALPPRRAPRWQGWREAARAAYLQHITPIEAPGAVNLAKAIAALNDALPTNVIMVNDAGNNAGWLHRFYQYRPFPCQLAPTSGAMGYGLPAAIGAKLTSPERPVVAMIGDGCLQMSAQELATAVEHRLSLAIVVLNNQSYGTIRMHQEMHYPGRVIASDLPQPDFVKLAEAYGAAAIRVGRTEDFVPAILAALARQNQPTLIDVTVALEAISPRFTLSEIKARAQNRTTA